MINKFFVFLVLLLPLSSASSVEVFNEFHTGVGDQPYVDWSSDLSSDYDSIHELQFLLDSSNYGVPYSVPDFDCVDSSILCEQFLERHHYRAWCFSSFDYDHAWVVARLPSGGLVGVETTYDTMRTMGKVIRHRRYLEGFVYETGAMFSLAVVD